MNVDQQQASGTALLAIVNRRAVLGAGARPSRVTAWPFVKSARLLSAEGHPADAVIEMWRPNTDAWALRGHLNSVAATMIDGETASRLRQERLAGSRSREERSQRPVAGPPSSSGRFWRVPGSAAEAGPGRRLGWICSPRLGRRCCGRRRGGRRRQGVRRGASQPAPRLPPLGSPAK